MPGGLGASYRSLTGDVYKTTTTNNETKFSVIETVKKAFSFTNSQKQSEPLIGKDHGAVIMPSTMPSDSMDDIELKNIQMHMPTTRSLSRDDPSIEEVRVQTDRGQLLVAIQGNRNKPAILTYHDLGLNCE
ncbi:uncharacterized protein LOC112126321 isoform X2 [Cimex lectularius]|uniref:Protein NDRG3 n=1 Tax=Cimex lectularius TaxID=79782 RepID=A0A8I6SF65_CIMLE|nr:uncharacterized protein LOC112126321 isoform X2 [Cimex lectularius]